MKRAKIGNLRIDIDEKDWFQKQVLDGSCEWEIIDVISKYLFPNDTFIDVGSHVGIISLRVASEYMKLTRSLDNHCLSILAFEPDICSFLRLKNNFFLNQNVDFPIDLICENCVISNKNQMVDFWIADQSGWSSCKKPNPTQSSVRKYYGKIRSDTLDYIYSSRPHLKIPNIVKIDAEGSEFDILRGMKNILKTIPPRLLIVEKNKWYMSSCDMEDMDLYMKQFNYKADNDLIYDEITINTIYTYDS